MKLSTRARYGIKAMVELATEYGSGSMVSVSTLAARQGVSEAYLEQLIRALKNQGLVAAERGAQGGYALTRAPQSISVGEMLKALEGSTTIVDCVSNENVSCDNACSCAARPLWIKLQSRINDVLTTTTLADMAEDYITQQNRGQTNESIS